MRVSSGPGIRRQNVERGATLVEASLLFVLTLIMLAALLELGLLVAAQFDLSQAVREGARLASFLEAPDSEASKEAVFNKINSELVFKRLYRQPINVDTPLYFCPPSSLRYVWKAPDPSDPGKIITNDLSCNCHVTVTASVQIEALGLVLKPFADTQQGVVRSTTLRSQAQNYCNGVAP